MFQAKLAAFPGQLLAPRREPIDRTMHGLQVTGLLEDLRSGGPHTLIAPINRAYDALPWAFEELLFNPSLTEPRFDLFEYLVLRGDWPAVGPGGERQTAEGTPLRIARGFVVGRHGTAMILRSFVRDNLRVHVVDACVFPANPQIYVDVREELCEERLC